MLTVKTSQALGEKLRDKTAKLAVIGLGYVGLPLAMEFARVGFSVYGIDDNKAKVAKVNEGLDYINDQNDALRKQVEERRITAGCDYDALSEKDVVVICVPTPLTRHREPDISYVTSVGKEVAQRLRPGQLVVLESTTYPGTTDEVLLPMFAAGGKTCGEDFYLAFSPERVDPGNKTFGTSNTPKIIGGVTPECSQLTRELYASIISEVHVASSARVAEMVKLLENIFRCVNIALVNELALLSRRMDVDIWEVIRLASTKPYGYMPFYPGPGLGGHCIPIDPFYLTWKAREYDFQTRFIELAGEINMQMPERVIDLVIDALGTRFRPLRGSKVMVLGAAYKRDVADARESPSLKIIELLERRGALVSYNDDLIPSIEVGGKAYASTPTTDLEGYDCVIIATDHSTYDYAGIVQSARLVVDTRNATGARGEDHVFVL
jgi:UDP-N-acetyl-D-glucosamine dehydrogenase